MAVPLRSWTDRARALGYRGASGLVGYLLLKWLAIPVLNRWMRKSGVRFQHYSAARDRAVPIRKLSTKMLLDASGEEEVHPWWEAVRKLPLHGGIVFDVGANVGVTSIWLAGMAERVYAFEPSSENQMLLLEQLSLRRVANVELIRAAVSNTSGTAVLFVKTSSMAHSLARIGKSEPVSEVRVDTWSLDDFARDRRIARIALLKIDTEGYEPEVIRGATELLSTGRIAHVLFEYSPKFYAERGLDPAMLLGQLEELGFAIFDLTGAPVDPVSLAGDTTQRDLLARPR
jgi:FkbM family methyltransferase